MNTLMFIKIRPAKTNTNEKDVACDRLLKMTFISVFGFMSILVERLGASRNVKVIRIASSCQSSVSDPAWKHHK